MKHHLFLLGAIVAEVVATSALKASEGLNNLRILLPMMSLSTRCW